jgi:hypothetical protein
MQNQVREICKKIEVMGNTVPTTVYNTTGKDIQFYRLPGPGDELRSGSGPYSDVPGGPGLDSRFLLGLFIPFNLLIRLAGTLPSGTSKSFTNMPREPFVLIYTDEHGSVRSVPRAKV